MKKPLKSYFPLLLSLCLLFVFPFQAMSAKQNKNNDNGGENANNTKVLKVINRDGDSVVDGSVLNPRDDEIHIYLQQLLSVLKKGDLSKLSIVLTSAVDSTKTFSVPREAISVQKKKIGKKSGKYLTVSLYNLTTPSGIIVPPSALPTDKYRLRIVSKKNEIATDSFHYRTPVLLVGKVKSSDGKGLVSVEDIEGGQLSDKTVAVNPNGTFITEVKAGKILEAKERIKAKRPLKALKAQEVADESATVENDEDSSGEESTSNTSDNSYIGVIHAVTDKDLFAIAPLQNNTKFNTSVASKPIEVSEASTLATTLAKEGAKEKLGDLAGDVADDKLKDLQGSEETSEPEDIGCDIEQFASLCSEGDFNTVGSEFRKFVAIAKCSFSEFDVLKKFLSNAPEDANNFIGRGYCSYVDGEVNQNKPCEVYSNILAEYKAGKIKQLPCPPPFCKEFSSIKPPACVEYVGDFCEGSNKNPTLSSQVCRGSKCVNQNAPVCIHKPVKDLYCAEIGKDIAKEECSDQGFEIEFVGFQPNWTVVKNSQGNEFCVPSNLPPHTPLNAPKIVNFGGPSGVPSVVEITPEVIAEECEVNRCHNDCAQKFGFTSPIDTLSIKPGSELEKASLELHNCHFACDAEAGRVVDCGNPKSKYFSNKCCANNFAGPVLYTKTDLLAQTSNFDLSGFSNTDYGYGSEFSGSNASGYGGFGSNYNGPGKGPIFNDIRGCLCKDLDNFNEKSFVEEGVLDFCSDNCPLDYEIDASREYCLPICQADEVRDSRGICRKKCPQGFIEDAVGNCICPEGKVVGRSGKCEEPPACPDYCRNYSLYRELLARHDLGSLGSNSGTSSSTTSTVPISTGLPSPLAGSSQPLTSATGAIPSECQKCLLGSNNVCPSGQRYDPVTNQCVSNISCGVDQYSGPDGVCRCNYDNSVATSLGPEGCKKQNQCPGNMYPNSNPGTNQPQCICPSGLPYWDNNQGFCVAQCPIGTKPNNSTGYPFGAPIPCEKTPDCPFATPIKCSDGRCAVTQLECSTQSCPPPYVVNPSGNPPCKCPASTPITYNGTCVFTCPSGLTADHPYVPSSTSVTTSYASPLTCLCPNKTYPNTNGTCTRTCAPGEITTSTNTCTCAGGGYFESTNTCRCSSGQTYTASGCISTSNYCVAGTGPTTNPSNPCSCTPPGYVGTNGLCQCPPGYSIAYSSLGCGSTLRNCQASETETPLVCQCAPGAIKGLNGYCQCPSGKTYSLTGCSTFNCPSPYISNPSGNPPCICPSSTPITYNGTCVATCPSGLTADYPYVSPSTSGTTSYASPLTCLCPNKTYPNANGTCTRTCAPGEVSSSSNPCTCANGGYFGSGNTCQCTSGQTYTATGCSSTTTCPSSTPIRCSDGTCVVAAANCPLTGTPATPSALTATVSTSQSGNVLLAWTDNSNNETYFSVYRRPSGGTTWTLVTSGVGSNVTSYTETLGGGTYEYHVNACNSFGCSIDSNIISVIVAASPSCPSGQISTASGCKTICDSGWNTVNQNCACGTGATQTSTNYCSCPTGQIYSQPGCGLGQVTLDSVVINGSNVVVSYTKNFVTCAHLQTSSFVKLHTQNHFCSNSGPITVPLSSFNATFQNGLQVKLCHGNNSNICSQLVTVTTSSPTPTPTPSPTPQPITLNSAVINNGNTISLNYSQVSNEGTKLKTIDNINLHAYNFSFGVFSSGTEFPVPWFYSNLMAGTQIKLCHVLNSSVCSQPVTVTESSIRTCNAGETSSLTSANPCKCTLYGSPNQYSNYTCSCGNGRTYSSITGCGTHICASGEVFNFNDQCACAAGAKFDQLTNKCICLSGQTYTASGCISSIPNAPSALTTTVSSSGSGTVTLTWTDNSTNEDSFKIYRRPLGSATWDTAISINISNVTSYTDTVFTSGTYEYRVNACNTNGCSVDSNIATVSVVIQRITLNSATVSGDTITYNFTKDSSDCLNLYTSGGTLINIPSYCHGGASGVGYPLSTLNNNLQPGISVKLCYKLDPTVCSNLVTLGGSFITHTCAPNETYSSTNICNCASGASPNLQNICACSGSNIYTTTGCQVPQVTLYSVVINQTDSTVSVNYSKNFNDCTTLKYSNSNTAAHSGDLFCTNTGNINVPLSTFNQTKFQNSVNVKLCNSTGTCSSTTQVSGPNICVPGGSPTSGTCSCFSPAGPDPTDTYKRCACPLGSIYTNSNGASFCRRYCNVGEVNYGLPNDQCSCGVYGAANSTGCSCSNGNIYNSQTACGADQHI